MRAAYKKNKWKIEISRNRKKEKMKLRRGELLIIDPITSSVSITICIAVRGMIR